ncbi:oxygen-dependent tRNA uridine(34) hydroxylase TrhO [Rhodococcus marinonascens]|uniref:oxygen-dependent tRNA uridine(34) hydroxylase TrhO n=1 Tax=Rhodococcus marinonascens TaxID=38311 RepID=UPI000935036B|nr:rhodanese-related sulfurtransferase [Rhodococcus marinonascens]
MTVPKIVLFYVFTPLADPEAIRLWQYTLAEAHNLTGRILVSHHGINATVGGDIRDVKRYVKGTRSYAPFKTADIKWSDGRGDDFPRLSVKVRPEIVAFGAPGELKVDADGVVGGGTHLAPEDVHRLVEGRGEDVVFFDGRNAFEAQIGRFRDAVVPDVSTTREFVHELDSGKYDHLKEKAVVTYCTGGVRCEVLSSLMRSRGFGEVYQLDGGIVRYGETFGDAGLWEGSLYVFDRRMNIEFTDQAKTLGRCIQCDGPTSRYENLSKSQRRRLALVCVGCTATNRTD